MNNPHLHPPQQGSHHPHVVTRLEPVAKHLEVAKKTLPRPWRLGSRAVVAAAALMETVRMALELWAAS